MGEGILGASNQDTTPHPQPSAATPFLALMTLQKKMSGTKCKYLPCGAVFSHLLLWHTEGSHWPTSFMFLGFISFFLHYVSILNTKDLLTLKWHMCRGLCTIVEWFNLFTFILDSRLKGLSERDGHWSKHSITVTTRLLIL